MARTLLRVSKWEVEVRGRLLIHVTQTSLEVLSCFCEILGITSYHPFMTTNRKYSVTASYWKTTSYSAGFLPGSSQSCRLRSEMTASGSRSLYVNIETLVLPRAGVRTTDLRKRQLWDKRHVYKLCLSEQISNPFSWVNIWPRAMPKEEVSDSSPFVWEQCPWFSCLCQDWGSLDLVSPPRSSVHYIIRTRGVLQVQTAGAHLLEQRAAGTHLQLEENFQIFVWFFLLGNLLFYLCYF